MRDAVKQRTPFRSSAMDDHWPLADREFSIVLEDQPPQSPNARAGTDRIVLANRKVDLRVAVKVGEVVRLRLTNAAPFRPFRLKLPGARVKLIGSGAGQVESEKLVDEVALVPGERVVVDVVFEEGGERRLEHRSPGRSLTVATFHVGSGSGPTEAYRAFASLRTNPELARLRRALTQHLSREPDATIATRAVDSRSEGALSTSSPLPKLRIINDATPRRPRQHLVRLEEGRCVAISRDGVPVLNLVWTNTLLLRAGEVIDVLVEPTSRQTLCLLVRDVETPGAGGSLRLRLGR